MTLFILTVSLNVSLFAGDVELNRDVRLSFENNVFYKLPYSSETNQFYAIEQNEFTYLVVSKVSTKHKLYANIDCDKKIKLSPMAFLCLKKQDGLDHILLYEDEMISHLRFQTQSKSKKIIKNLHAQALTLIKKAYQR